MTKTAFTAAGAMVMAATGVGAKDAVKVELLNPTTAAKVRAHAQDGDTADVCAAAGVVFVLPERHGRGDADYRLAYDEWSHANQILFYAAVFDADGEPVGEASVTAAPRIAVKDACQVVADAER